MTKHSETDHKTASADDPFLPGPVLLLGAPGVGKGTQAQILMKKFNIPQISTGDILRANIAQGTDLGKAAKVLMDEGQLVPDDLVNDMVGMRLSQSDVHAGYILDGFPRTLAQARWLDAQLPRFRETSPLVAVKLHVATDELLRRITGRRTCPTCKRIYNIYSHPPQQEGVCDFDPTPLVQRSDDTEPAFRERMKAYDALTSPVIEHYRDKERYREVDGMGTVGEVAGRVLTALRELREVFPSGRWNSQTGQS